MSEDYELKPDLTFKEVVISESIQTELASTVTRYLHHKRSLIDALDWILTTIINDYKNELDVYKNTWESGNEDIKAGYICRSCALKLKATPRKDYGCTWHHGKCYFCGEETNLCHTSDWNWTDRRYLEEDREV